MVAQLTKALKRRNAERKRPSDTLSTPDGEAIPVWQAGAGDPVAHLAGVFDQLPGRRPSLRTTTHPDPRGTRSTGQPSHRSS